VIAAPVFALSTLNCTLATPTSSVALAVKVAIPESVAFAVGDVMETVGGVVSGGVVQRKSPLTADLFWPSAECTRQ
jgi:hypothetical protein